MSRPGAGASNRSPLYRNPFRNAAVTPARIDMGVDYLGRPGDPIYAVGRGTVVESYPSGTWPGNPGGFVGYKLSEGPQKDRTIYVAEDVAPQVSVGDKVTANTVIATFGPQAGSAYGANGPGLETGWADPGSQPNANTLAAAQNEIAPGDPGGWTSLAGADFSNFLASLGAPAGVPQAGGVHGPGGRIVPGFKFGKGGPTGNLPPGSYKNLGGNLSPNCLVSIPQVKTFGFFGPTVGGNCLLDKTQARAAIGAGILLLGGGLFLIATLILAAYGLKGTGAGPKAAKAAGKAAEIGGAAVALIPGAEGAGAATAAAGKVTSSRAERRAPQRSEPRTRPMTERRESTV